ncbi:hypothetical protein [Aquimixticola soesokkakensis]|nr:hypothetical protein [Aquimixticola soesokkakensis]
MRYCTAVTLVGSGNFANLPRSLVEATQAVVSQARRSQDAQIEDLSRHIDVSRSAPCVIQIAQG